VSLWEECCYANLFYPKTNTISCASSFIKGMRKDPNGKTLGISPWEKEALVSFLYVLTDSTFLHNPEFSNPHNDTNLLQTYVFL